MDEEYHGRELRRLEQKAAKQRTSTTSSGPATFDDLATFDKDLASRRAKSGTKEVRAVYAGHSRPPSAKALGELDLSAFAHPRRSGLSPELTSLCAFPSRPDLASPQ